MSAIEETKEKEREKERYSLGYVLARVKEGGERATEKAERVEAEEDKA
jgi:hypothetical protein